MFQEWRTFISVLLSGMLALCAGCEASRYRKHELARFDAKSNLHEVPATTQPEVLEPVRYSGRYKIVVQQRVRRTLLPDSMTDLQAGDSVGFRHNPDGTITALAYRSEIPFGPLKRSIRYLAWQPVELYEAPVEHNSFGSALGHGVGWIFTIAISLLIFPLLMVLYSLDARY